MAVAATHVLEDHAPASRDRAAETRPVDLVHLAKFTMGDRNLESEVLTLFARQSELYLARLREADDQKSWVEAAHTLKGSARGIGAWKVARAAEQAERSTDAVSRRQCIDDLAGHLAEANRFIRDLIPGA